MAKNTAAPQVPGAPTAPAATEDKATETTAPAAAAQNGDSETVTVSKSELAALMDRVARLEAAPAAAAQKIANPDESLPDQDSIDLDTLKSPVLTKQGWLMPKGYGNNPAAPKG